ncbi:FAD-dependent oxidoreductase [Kribbella sp. CWNU-51]
MRTRKTRQGELLGVHTFEAVFPHAREDFYFEFLLRIEERVAAAVLEEMLAPWRASGRLTVHFEHEPIAAYTGGDEIEAVTLRDLRSREELTVSAAYVVDATELGDLLELAGVEHVVGAESRATTGELHAPDVADPLDQQAFSWCVALEHRRGEDHTIDRPAEYAHWHDHVAPFWPGPQLSWQDVVPVTLERREWRLFEANPERLTPFSLWRYRQILASSNFLGDAIPDVTVVN